MKKKILTALIIIVVVILLLVVTGLHKPLVSIYCQTWADDLERSLQKDYEEYGTPSFGGITPEMAHEDCMEAFMAK